MYGEWKLFNHRTYAKANGHFDKLRLARGVVHKPPSEYTRWGWRTSKGPFGETGCAIRRGLEFECWEGCEEGERETGGSRRGWREAGCGAPSSVRRGPLVISVCGLSDHDIPVSLRIQTGHLRGANGFGHFPRARLFSSPRSFVASQHFQVLMAASKYCGIQQQSRLHYQLTWGGSSHLS